MELWIDEGLVGQRVIHGQFRIAACERGED